MNGSALKKTEKQEKSVRMNIWQRIVRARTSLNQYFMKRYTPLKTALLGAGLTGIIAFLELFVFHTLGVADDGSLNSILKETGLAYRAVDLKETVGAYFVRLYLKVPVQPAGFSFHRLLIRFAVFLDGIFTNDNLFDIRFLGIVYLILFLPAAALLILEVVRRVPYPSEGLFLMILCVLGMADASYITYFNSLYPEALWYLLLLYLFSGMLILQERENNRQIAGLLLMIISAFFLSFTETHMAAAGLVVAVFLLILASNSHLDNRLRSVSGLGFAFLTVFSLLAWNTGTNRFTTGSKMNAMTSGVLMESENPKKALSEFGIDQRFEVLTDTSEYTDFPVVLIGNEDIQENFLSRYSTFDIAFYYMRHPRALFSLVSLASRPAFAVRRDYVGNYEKSAGLPERARTPVLTAYSNLKSSIIPRTTGFLIILAVVFAVIEFRKKGTKEDLEAYHRRAAAFYAFYLALAIGLFHTITIGTLSGSSEFERYCMIYGVSIDTMLLLSLTEILHRLRIFQTE